MVGMGAEWRSSESIVMAVTDRTRLPADLSSVRADHVLGAVAVNGAGT
jgi:hypothetical protein